MEIQTKKSGSALKIALKGRLDTATSPELEEKLKKELTDTVSELDMDIAALEYISSAGLRVLLSAQKKMNASGGIMRVLHPNEIVEEVFEVTGFSEILTVEQ